MKKRFLILGAGVFILWANVFTSLASADTIAGNSVSCTQQPAILWSGSEVGYARFTIQFRLTVGAHSAVAGRWEDSNGASGPFKWWGNNTDVAQAFWTSSDSTGGANSPLGVNLAPGSSATARFVLQKSGAYGDCFSAAAVVVTRTPYTEGGGGTGGGGGGIATPSPSPTPNPSATPTPSPTPSPTGVGGCQLVTDPDCVPPSGFCWGFGPPAPSADYPLVPCETPSPSPSPSATPEPPCTSWSDDSGIPPNNDEYSDGLCEFTLTNGLYYRVSGNYTVNLNSWGTSLSIAGLYTAGGHSVASWALGCAGGGVNINNATRQYSSWCEFTGTTGSYVFRQTSGGGGGTGWYYEFVAYLEAGINSDGSPVPSSTPTATPSASAGGTGEPTLPPGWPTPSAPSGGSFGEVCAPGSYSEVLCSPAPDYSFAPASPDADGFDAVLSELGGKAPFGYVSQLVDAIDGGAGGAAGAGLDECFTLPYWTAVGMQEAEGCLPLQDMADDASWVRTPLLAMLMMVVGVGLLKWVNRSSGGGS